MPDQPNRVLVVSRQAARSETIAKALNKRGLEMLAFETTAAAAAALSETPADAALMMQLGCEGNFVGSGIFKSGDPLRRAKAIVAATTYFDKPEILAEISEDLGEPMVGIGVSSLRQEELLASRGI